jgi:hypothetical protein
MLTPESCRRLGQGERMPHLALYTFGTLKAPLADAGRLTREFNESVMEIYRDVNQTPGYIAHADPVEYGPGAQFDWDWAQWGEFVVPSWYDKGRTGETTALAATMSVWTDLKSAFDFVYTDLHRVALNRRYDWFEKTGRPGLVFWWIADGTMPTWQDGVPRLEYLEDHEPTPYAFTFRHPFTEEGEPTKLEAVGRSGGQATLAAA